MRAFRQVFLGMILGCALAAAAQDAAPRVQMAGSDPGPRSVEDLTRKSILRDYAAAWKAMAQALSGNAPQGVGGYFVGTPAEELRSRIAAQKQAGLRSLYSGGDHMLEAVFYSPEGDVIELHDTVQCELQTVRGQDTLDRRHVTLHYVVLMTPAADRWVVRQLQAVPAF